MMPVTHQEEMRAQEGEEIAEILQYFQQAQASPQKTLQRLHAELETQYAVEPHRRNIMKLALLLSMPDTGFQDTSRAIGMLETYFEHEEPKSDFMHSFASLLRYMLTEQKNQETLQNMVSQKLYDTIAQRDEKERLYELTNQKLHVALSEKKRQALLYEKLHKALDDAKDRVEMLQKKIEQLKTIEKIIKKRKNPKAPAT